MTQIFLNETALQALPSSPERAGSGGPTEEARRSCCKRAPARKERPNNAYGLWLVCALAVLLAAAATAQQAPPDDSDRIDVQALIDAGRFEEAIVALRPLLAQPPVDARAAGKRTSPVAGDATLLQRAPPPPPVPLGSSTQGSKWEPHRRGSVACWRESRRPRLGEWGANEGE